MARSGVYSVPNNHNVFSSMNLNEIKCFTPNGSTMECGQCGDHEHPTSKKLLVSEYLCRAFLKLNDCGLSVAISHGTKLLKH